MGWDGMGWDGNGCGAWGKVGRKIYLHILCIVRLVVAHLQHVLGIWIDIILSLFAYLYLFGYHTIDFSPSKFSYSR